MRRLLLVAACLLVSAPALAQEQKLPPVFTLTVAPDEAQLILNALTELPVKVSLKLIEKLQNQAGEQIKAANTAPAEKKD